VEGPLCDDVPVRCDEGDHVDGQMDEKIGVPDVIEELGVVTAHVPERIVPDGLLAGRAAQVLALLGQHALREPRPAERIVVLGRIDGGAVPPARSRVLAEREREERGEEHNDGQTVQTMAHRFEPAFRGVRVPPRRRAWRRTTL